MLSRPSTLRPAQDIVDQSLRRGGELALGIDKDTEGIIARQKLFFG
jgi:hypothetical protein